MSLANKIKRQLRILRASKKDVIAGLFSGFPLCCISFYSFIRMPFNLIANYNQWFDSRHIGLWGYVPCPICVYRKNKVIIRNDDAFDIQTLSSAFICWIKWHIGLDPQLDLNMSFKWTPEMFNVCYYNTPLNVVDVETEDNIDITEMWDGHDLLRRLNGG